MTIRSFNSLSGIFNDGLLRCLQYADEMGRSRDSDWRLSGRQQVSRIVDFSFDTPFAC